MQSWSVSRPWGYSTTEGDDGVWGRVYEPRLQVVGTQRMASGFVLGFQGHDGSCEVHWRLHLPDARTTQLSRTYMVAGSRVRIATVIEDRDVHDALQAGDTSQDLAKKIGVALRKTDYRAVVIEAGPWVISRTPTRPFVLSDKRPQEPWQFDKEADRAAQVACEVANTLQAYLSLFQGES